MLLNDVIVVQEPLTRGAHLDATADARGEPRVRVVEEQSGVTESEEERALPRSASSWGETLALGDRPRAVCELIRSQELATQRAGEEVLSSGDASSEEPREAADLF